MADIYKDRIKPLFDSSGLMNKDLEAKIGIPEKKISDWNAGRLKSYNKYIPQIASYFHVSVDYLLGNTDDPSPAGSNRRGLPPEAEPIDLSGYHEIPIMGRISAGIPIYAEEHIEGYTMTDRNGGAEYFALRVFGDSMNAARIQEGDLVIVRRQDEVEQGEIAVVLVGDEDATVKRFYSSDSTVTLMPQSTNPVHQPQFYDISKTRIQVLGKVVEVKFSL